MGLINPYAPSTVQARWRVLGLTCVSVVLSMTTWFSATAVTPELTRTLHLSVGAASWLTSAVQIGFVAGALGSSVSGLPDRVPLWRLMALSAVLAAVANLTLLAAAGPGLVLAARFMTGVALAGVYPPALKLIATWFVRGRGVAMGAVIGALTLGSALPHLMRASSGSVDWRAVVLAASVMTLLGAGLFAAFASEGPHAARRSAFDPRQLGRVLGNRGLLLTNLGYFGHMWELYAMWGWFLAYASAALPRQGIEGPAAASLTTFAVVAVGILGCVAGGVLADKVGRTATTLLMLSVSGCCALLIGFVFDGPTWLFLIVAALWGISVIGDSAQFSAMATEVGDPSLMGTALALQLGVGFALTVVSVRLTPILANVVGWRWVFPFLAPGPCIGIIAMLVLRRLPEARSIAGGLR